MSADDKKIQEKQLFAQRVTAAATVANAVATAQQAANIERMRRQMEANAESEERHRVEMAAQQERMVEQQDEHNFHLRILATLPLLKDEEKPQFVLDQLLPKITEKRLSWDANRMQRSVILKKSGLFEFASSYSGANPTVKEFFIASKPWNALRALQVELQEVEKKEFKRKKFLNFGFLNIFSCLFVMFIMFFFLIIVIVSNIPSNPNESPSPDQEMLSTFEFIFGIGAIFLFQIFFVRKKNAGLQAAFLKEKKLKIEALKNKINSLGDIEEILKTHESIWGKIKDQFVEDYLTSASGKEFLGEKGKRKLLLIVTNPWREIVAEQQNFLPPSARPSFDEHWLPLLIREDKILRKAVAYLENFQLELREVFVKFVQPDFDKKAIIIKPDKEFTDDDEHESEDLIEECIELIRSEQKASVSLLQNRLRLGYCHASRIMDELEGRGIVGPSKGWEPRDIL